MPNVRVDPAFSKKAAKLFKKHPSKRKRVQSALAQLAENPRHSALRSKKYDAKHDIWQSYVEHGTPSAWRVWWKWDPSNADTIVVLAFGPHP